MWDLLQTFSSLLSSLSSERIIDLYEEVSVNEKITLIAELLEEKEEFLFTELVKRRSILEIVCAFWAILELVKERRVTVLQNRLFGDIRVRARRPVPEPDRQREATGMELSKDAALIEAILLLESDPVELRKLSSISGLSPEAAQEAVEQLRQGLDADAHGLEIVEIGGGFAFAPRKDLWEELGERYGKNSENPSLQGGPGNACHHRVFPAHHPGGDRGHSRRRRRRHDQAPPEPGTSSGKSERKTRLASPCSTGRPRSSSRPFRLATISDLPKLHGLERERFEQE